MGEKTQVRNVQVRTGHMLERPTICKPVTDAVQLDEKPTWDVRILRADNLLRNLAVTGALLLTVVAVKNLETPESQSVFAALQASAGMEWDESLGKLSFVNSLLPESIQAVWSNEADITVLAPAQGELLHAWSEREPYVLIGGSTADVRAAENGEVMSIARGLEEERIIRVRHDNGTEALYGNLLECYAQEGDRVYAGDVIAKVLDGKALAFELRVDGRSIDPTGKMLTIEE